MSDKKTSPVTPAIRVLRENNVNFIPHLYKYEEKGGTAVSSRKLGVEEHCVVKTLIMEDEKRNPIIVLMHGDCQVSTKELARIMKVKMVTPCSPETANKHSGYMVGGTSPFGTRKVIPVYMEESIAMLEKVYINGGKRGFLVEIKTEDIIKILKPLIVNVAI